MNEPRPTQPSTEIATNGGSVISGNVTVETGDFVGRDKITHIHQMEEAYDVRGLPNPYLGLQAFTYREQGRYAGREACVRDAANLLTRPGEQCSLLFVTGASGSGKSSFVQAGLLPALEQFYQERNLTVRWSVFRPSSQPLAGLADALLKLGLSATGVFAAAAPFTFVKSKTTTTSDQISLLLIDQFEELFIQSKHDHRNALFDILEKIPPFVDLRVHIICTFRIDYLPDLFPCQTLYDIAKRGIDLRVMNEHELRSAILRPLQQVCPDSKKRFEDALLEKLVKDASGDAAYLPLLQVTLEDLWRRGSLKLSAYGNLTDAIQQHADTVLHFKQETDGRSVARSQTEQREIMQIFLDLVEVSLDDDNRRDVRRQRTLEELTKYAPTRRQLIDELSSKRLLSIDVEKILEHSTGVEKIDIIHESLIVNWNELKTAIAEQRQILQQRVRFKLALHEWLKRSKVESYLLDGVQLAEAEKLDQSKDIELQSSRAQEFLNLSIQRRESREQRRRNILVGVVATLSVLFASALIIAGIAYQQWSEKAEEFDRAERAENLSFARFLTVISQDIYQENPLLGMRLALEGLARVPEDEPQVRRSLAESAREQAKHGRLLNLGEDVGQIYASPDNEGFIIEHRLSNPEYFRISDGLRVLLPDRLESLSANPVPKVEIVTTTHGSAYFLVTYQSNLRELRSMHNGRSVSVPNKNLASISTPHPDYLVITYDVHSNYSQSLHLAENGQTLITQTKRIVFSEDGQFITITYDDKPTELWSAFAQKPLLKLSPGIIQNSSSEYTFVGDDGRIELLSHLPHQGWVYGENVHDTRAIFISDRFYYVIIDPMVKAVWIYRTADHTLIARLDEICRVNPLTDLTHTYSLLVVYENQLPQLVRVADGTPINLAGGVAEEALAKGYSLCDHSESVYFPQNLPKDYYDIWLENSLIENIIPNKDRSQTYEEWEEKYWKYVPEQEHGRYEVFLNRDPIGTYFTTRFRYGNQLDSDERSVDVRRIADATSVISETVVWDYFCWSVGNTCTDFGITYYALQDKQGIAQLYDINNQSFIDELPSRPRRLYPLNDEYFVIEFTDNSAQLRKMKDGQLVHLPGKVDQFLPIKDPTGTYSFIITYRGDQFAELVRNTDIERIPLSGTIKTADNIIFPVTYPPQDDYFFVKYTNGTIGLHDIGTGAFLDFVPDVPQAIELTDPTRTVFELVYSVYPRELRRVDTGARIPLSGIIASIYYVDLCYFPGYGSECPNPPDPVELPFLVTYKEGGVQLRRTSDGMFLSEVISQMDFSLSLIHSLIHKSKSRVVKVTYRDPLTDSMRWNFYDTRTGEKINISDGIRNATDVSLVGDEIIVLQFDNHTEVRRIGSTTPIVTYEALLDFHSVDPTDTYFVLSFRDGTSVLHQASNGIRVPISNTDARISFDDPTATYFTVISRAPENQSAVAEPPGEVRRISDATIVPLPGIVLSVDFKIDPSERYYLVNYKDRVSELRSYDNRQVVRLTGRVATIYPIDTSHSYFVVIYHDANSEIRSWKTLAVARNLGVLGGMELRRGEQKDFAVEVLPVLKSMDSSFLTLNYLINGSLKGMLVQVSDEQIKHLELPAQVSDLHTFTNLRFVILNYEGRNSQIFYPDNEEFQELSGQYLSLTPVEANHLLGEKQDVYLSIDYSDGAQLFRLRNGRLESQTEKVSYFDFCETSRISCTQKDYLLAASVPINTFVLYRFTNKGLVVLAKGPLPEAAHFLVDPANNYVISMPQSFIWHSRFPERWVELGSSVSNVYFGPKGKHLLVNYMSGKTELLDLEWLSKMAEIPNDWQPEDIRKPYCDGPFKKGLLNETLVNNYLEGRPSLACSQPFSHFEDLNASDPPQLESPLWTPTEPVLRSQ